MNPFLMFLALSLTLGVVAANPSQCRECTDLWNALHADFVDLDACKDNCLGMTDDSFTCSDNGVNRSRKRCCRKLCRKQMDPFAACANIGLCTLADSRFNKLPTIEDGTEASTRTHVASVHKNLFPLLPEDYGPLDQTKAITLKAGTKADSVVLPQDVQLYGDSDVNEWLTADPVTGAMVSPIFPGEEGFWDELKQVVEAQIAREDKTEAEGFFEWSWPETWKDRSLVNLSPWPDSKNKDRTLMLSDVAEAVNGEYPAYHQQIFVKKLLQEDVALDLDLGQPFRSAVDFIGKAVRLGEINTWTFEAVAPVNFMLKWHFGMPRPEEMAYKIYKGDFKDADQVPAELVALIQGMKLKNAHDFTAYKSNGSPFHPSYPAMHSAGSTCSFWLPAICKLTGEQYLEALRVDYAVAMGRTIAGVHYVQDNLVGLNIGQRIIRKKLPEFLSEMYGYDEGKVTARLEKLSFDWKNFNSTEGTIEGKPVADFLAEAMAVE